MEELTEAISTGAPQQNATAAEQFECVTCGRKFGSSLALQTHTVRAHRKFWSTKKPQRRPRLITNRRRARAGKLECPECHEPFTIRGYMARHLRLVHGKSIQDFPQYEQSLTCPECGQKFVSAGNLGMHMKRTHGQSLKAFRNGESPARRMGRPKGSGIKTCPVCSRTFKTRPLMTHHLRNVHKRSVTEFQERGGHALKQQPETPAPTHKRGSETCPVCNKIVSKAYLYHHVRSQHGKTLTQAKAEQNPTAAQPNASQQHAGRHVIFCPVCGTNIQNVQTAVNFGQ